MMNGLPIPFFGLAHGLASRPEFLHQQTFYVGTRRIVTRVEASGVRQFGWRLGLLF